MNFNPDMLDASRMRYLRGFLSAMCVFLVLWFVRFFLRAGDFNQTTFGLIILGGLIIMLVLMVYFQTQLVIINLKISRDPAIEKAVNDELYHVCLMRAWKPAFITTASTTVGLALTAFIYPVIDLMFVALTGVIAGSFAYLLSLYLYWRAA